MSEEEREDNYEYELEVQQKIVALLFQDFTYLSTVGVELIKPSYFDNTYLRLICKWILDYYEQYHTKPTEAVLLTELSNYTDKVTLPLSEQERFASLIRDLSTLVVDDSEYIKDQALDFAKKVAMRDAIEKLMDVYQKGTDYEKAVNIIDDALSVGAGSNLGMSLLENLDNLPSMLKETYDPDNLFVTNLPTLDDAFGGGMAKGELYVFCLDGDTKVKTNKGNIPIKDLIDNFKDKKVYSVNENGKRFETEVYDVWKTRDTNELIALTFEDGSVIKCTPDHKFRILNPNKNDTTIIWAEGISYKQAQDLNEYDDLNLVLVNKQLIKLEKPLPVYNLTVNNKYHNFELSNGVISKNCGAPGRGKSKFLSYLAFQAMFQNKPVVYFTFEWSEKEVIANIISCATAMTMRDLMDESQIEKYKLKVAKLKMFAPNVRTIYHSNKTVTSNHLRTYLTKLHSLENFTPGLIIVDYADLMLPNKQTRRSSDSTYEEMGTIFYDLKALADQFNCPVVTGSQLGKAAWNTNDNDVASQDMLADSSRKAHVAYGIVTLNQTREEADVKKMRLYVAKARRGKTNTTVFVEFDKAINQIHECAEYDVKELKKAAGK